MLQPVPTCGVPAGFVKYFAGTRLQSGFEFGPQFVACFGLDNKFTHPRTLRTTYFPFTLMRALSGVLMSLGMQGRVLHLCDHPLESDGICGPV